MSLFEPSVWLQLIVFPVATLGIWTLLFNSQNTLFTKIFIEGGYLIFVVPLVILTFLSIPAMALIFWANSAGFGQEMTYSILAVSIGVTLIIEYFYIKRQIRIIEEREQMSFWKWIRREMDSETQQERSEKKVKTKDEAREFFDEISIMNKKKRDLDREQKEKLRKALLGEVNQE